MIFDPAKYPFLDFEWKPTNESVYVIHAPFDQVVSSWRDWWSRLEATWDEQSFDSVARKDAPLRAQLAAFFGRLDPLQRSSPRKLLVEIGSEMTAYFSNGFSGTGQEAMSYMSGRLECDGYGFVCSISPGAGGASQRLQGITFQRESNDPKRRRWVGAVREGNLSWYDFGAPLAFEKIERYSAPRIPDRLTFDMLVDYGARLGVHPFDATTYLSSRSILMTRTDFETSVGSVSREEWRRMARYL